MRTREIGHAAFALTRFRFVRALVASGLVNIPLVLAIIGGSVAAGQSSWVKRVLAFNIVILAIAALIVGLTIMLNVIDRIHRRLWAFVSFYLVLVFPLIVAASAWAWAKPWTDTLGNRQGGLPTFSINVLGLAVTLFAFIVMIELACLAAWATLAPKAAYLSVRGWRPAWSEPLGNFTHQLGFPAFVAQIRRGRLGLGGLYFLIAILNIAFFGLMTELLWLPRPATAPKEIPTTLVLLAIPVVALLLLLLGLGRKLDHAARGRATRLYQAVREWDDRPPILFLRSFDQDEMSIRARTHDPLLQLPAGLGRKRELDEMLLETGAPFGPVIALGDPRNPIPPLGAARIYVRDIEQDWKGVVADLIVAARAIVICPQTSASVAWEIDQVRSPSVLARTIILASPGMSEADTARLFAEITGAPAVLKPRRRPIAAFVDPVNGWTLLSARNLTVQTYTVALNRSLQSLLQVKDFLKPNPS